VASRRGLRRGYEIDGGRVCIMGMKHCDGALFGCISKSCLGPFGWHLIEIGDGQLWKLYYCSS
jgi:hypothetical protein